jgi:hypothetical protein
MIVAPGNIIGLPIGVWALVVLWRREVRVAFSGQSEAIDQLPADDTQPRLSRLAIIGTLSVVVALIIRAFLLQPYVAATDAAAPEIPRGSHFLVWKLGHEFRPGDLIAYRHNQWVSVGRVVRSEDGIVSVNRNREADAAVPHADILGRVISVYWRASSDTTPIAEQIQKRMSELVAGQQILPEFDWSKLAAEGRILNGVPVTVDGRTALKIENTSDAPLQLALLKIEKPPITAMRYAVTGEIKYENVQGDGYLEMWNDFAAAGRFFTRTLAPAGQGPIGQISGTSSWRAFALPFDHTGTAGAPTRLEVNIFLPGRGVVFLGSVKLMQSANALSATTWSLPGRLSPFTEVVCHGADVKVRFEGQEYELVSVNDLTSKQILDYCRREYADRWEMRFADDLVEVLAGMGNPMTADQTVKLVLKSSDSDRLVTVERAPMTHKNREAVKSERERRAAADVTATA